MWSREGDEDVIHSLPEGEFGEVAELDGPEPVVEKLAVLVLLVLAFVVEVLFVQQARVDELLSTPLQVPSGFVCKSPW